MNAPSVTPVTEAPRDTPGEAFVFTGSAGEYARIWIVNLLLSILTLGIYSAWAKVRRLRYFYGNTLLQGHGFDYTANPVRILIGRVIAVGMLLAINGLSHLNQLFLLLLLPYFVALPWLINQSMAFNAQMTSYRNVRFSFHGNYWSAMGVFLLMPVVAAFSFGLLAPVASRLRVNYVGSRLRYGTAWFDTQATLRPLYKNLGASAIFLLVGAAVIFGIIMLASAALSDIHEKGQDGNQLAVSAILLLTLVPIYASFFIIFYVYLAGVRNVAFSATTLQGGHRLSSNLSRSRYLWIILSNTVIVICSLGLLWPVASVRNWRYLAACTTFHPAGSLDDFVDDQSRKSSAAAAEYLDLGGFDFGL